MMIAALFPEYRQQAFRYARWLVGNECDAEEIVQDAFCKLAERNPPGGGVSDEQAPAALLFAMIRNQSIDVLRRRKRRNNVPLASIAEPVNREPDISHALELNELHTSVRRAFDKLPRHWAEALRLKVAGELSYEEIATVMEGTLGQVRTWIYRARKQLAVDLTDQGWLEAVTGNDSP
jgi:RNA polymerase sigma-70 factor (ECF subfamily)